MGFDKHGHHGGYNHAETRDSWGEGIERFGCRSVEDLHGWRLSHPLVHDMCMILCA